MWISFAISVLLVCFVLYVPGALVLRSLNLRMLSSIACAPIVSMLFYCVLAVLLSYAGVKCSFALFAATAVIVSFSVFAVAAYLRSKNANGRLTTSRSKGRRDRFWALSALIYMFVGLASSAYFFLGAIGDPSSFAPTYDNVFHYNLIRSFAESGNWSALSASTYSLNADMSQNPFPSQGYYPAAWHLLCAMAVDSGVATVAVSANAVNFVVASVVFPLGVCFLMSVLFLPNRGIVLAGSIISVSFSSYPWFLLLSWPLFPNALSLSLLPPTAASFIVGCSADEKKSSRAAAFVVFALGCLCAAFAQPNLAFAVAAFLIPFCVSRVYVWLRRRLRAKGDMSLRVPLLGSALAVLGVALIWVLCYKLPFLQGAINTYWGPIMGKGESLVSVAGAAYASDGPQLLVAVLVFFGSIWLFLVRRDRSWLVFSYVIAAAIFVVSASFGDTFLKHFLSGFWYTDPYRIAAFTAIFGIPLASAGLYSAMKLISKLLAKIGIGEKTSMATAACLMVVLVLGFGVSHYVLPKTNAFGYSGMGALRINGEVLYDSSISWIYDDTEMKFVEKVKSTIPEDALVINQPFDGSAFARSIDGLNTYYHDISGYGAEGETDESIQIRNSLSTIATDRNVRESVARTNAQYVMILDRDESSLESSYSTYSSVDWRGINSIGDDTSGFEMVLSEGDMRLYRITATDGRE